MPAFPAALETVSNSIRALSPSASRRVGIKVNSRAGRPSFGGRRTNRALLEVEGLLALQGSRTLAVMNNNASVALLVAIEVASKFAGAHNSLASNPSVERTANGGARLRFFPVVEAPLSAAHLER